MTPACDRVGSAGRQPRSCAAGFTPVAKVRRIMRAGAAGTSDTDPPAAGCTATPQPSDNVRCRALVAIWPPKQEALRRFSEEAPHCRQASAFSGRGLANQRTLVPLEHADAGIEIVCRQMRIAHRHRQRLVTE